VAAVKQTASRRKQIVEELRWLTDILQNGPPPKDAIKAIQVVGVLRNELARVEDMLTAERTKNPVQRLRLMGKIAGREASFVAAQKFEAEAAKLQILDDDLRARRKAEQLEDAPEEEQEAMLLDSIPEWRRPFLAKALIEIADALDLDLGEELAAIVQREADAA